jgi:hypothetical protein
MSRGTVILIVVALLVIGGAFLLSRSAHEVPTKPIEVDVNRVSNAH